MARNVAFEILYKEYYLRVFGLCRRLLNSASLAEDATQEVFMRAYKSFNKYDTDQPFWHWIASIANNHCVDLLRRRTKTRQLFGDEQTELDELASSDAQPMSDLLSSENAEAVNQAVMQLPDKYRVPIVLAYFNDSSYDQIAADLAISKSHVGVLLLRAKKQLRASLESTMQQVTPR